jgi:hypothetical protein
MTTFFSVPNSDVCRFVSFTINIQDLTTNSHLFVNAWNDPFHGHVFTMELAEEEYVMVSNMSNEPMILAASSSQYGAYVIGQWGANEVMKIHLRAFTTGVFQTNPIVIVFQDTPIFKFTAYLHRKKTSQQYYAREEQIVLPKGVYIGIGHIAATLNQGITMRGERNGFIFHFVTRGGKLCVEASHKQPEPSFLEVVPLHTGLGLAEQDAMPLRTKERLEFPYSPYCLI